MSMLAGEYTSMQNLLSARQVQDMLNIDRSTVYRMADDGRLPAIRVGKQWRFQRDAILDLLAGNSPQSAASRSAQTPTHHPTGIDHATASTAIAVAADLLGVMMVVTDMEGSPVTDIANPSPWFTEHSHEPDIMAACTAEWAELAEEHDFVPQFHLGKLGFECARAFIRSRRELVGMVLAGGVCPADQADSQMHNLTTEERDRVLHALPKIANEISRRAPVRADLQTEESP